MFTVDWFSQNVAEWQRLFGAHHWNAEQPNVIVEIGSFEGRCTIWCLEHLLRHPESRIFCLDTFEGSIEHDEAAKVGLYERFAQNVLSREDAHKVEVIKGPSQHSLAELVVKGLQADFVYVDGSHQAPDVLEDLVLAFRIVKPGGLMIFDDYLWSHLARSEYDPLSTPKISIDAFTTIYARKIELCAFQRLWQLAVTKISD